MARRATDEEEDDDTIPCPYCGRAIHEEAERCPYCESYISEEDTPEHQPRPRPWWFLVGFLLCLIVIYFWIMRGW